MPFPVDEKTDEHIKNPQVGDRFTEMCAFWLYVLDVREDRITTIEANSPCEFPKDGTVIIQPIDQFRKRLAHGNIPGYWVRYVDGGHNVAGWYEFASRVENSVHK